VARSGEKVTLVARFELVLNGKHRSVTEAVPAFRRVWVRATLSPTGALARWIALVALELRVAHANIAVLAALRPVRRL
jgi:hypothetical protein